MIEAVLSLGGCTKERRETPLRQCCIARRAELHSCEEEAEPPPDGIVDDGALGVINLEGHAQRWKRRQDVAAVPHE